MPCDGVVRRHRRHRPRCVERGRGPRQQVPRHHPRERRDLPGHPGVHRPRRGPRRGRSPLKDDIETINTELVLADLQTVEKALPRLEKEARINKDRAELLDNALAAAGGTSVALTPARHSLRGGPGPRAVLRELFLLTAKPVPLRLQRRRRRAGQRGAEGRAAAELVAPAEACSSTPRPRLDLAELDDDEALELLQIDRGCRSRASTTLARVAFDTLGLQTYLTAGPKESRAWTIQQGCDRAGGRRRHPHRLPEGLHQGRDRLLRRPRRGRLRWPRPSRPGKVRIEGKDYVMADGDVVEFRFNV